MIWLTNTEHFRLYCLYPQSNKYSVMCIKEHHVKPSKAFKTYQIILFSYPCQLFPAPSGTNKAKLETTRSEHWYNIPVSSAYVHARKAPTAFWLGLIVFTGKCLFQMARRPVCAGLLQFRSGWLFGDGLWFVGSSGAGGISWRE